MRQDGRVTQTGGPGRALGALAGAGLAVALAAGPAAAEPPPDLVRQITDLNGELAEGETGLRSALAQLDTEDGIELYVVSVDSTDGQDIVEWADDAALGSGLPSEAPVLVLATRDQDYALSVGESFELSDAELDQVTDAAEAPFAQGDEAGAAAAAAQEMRRLAGGGGLGGGGIQAGGGGGFGALGLLGLLLVLGLVGGGIALAVRASRRGRSAAGPHPAPGGPWAPAPQEAPPVPVEELSRQAGSMLVATDEDVRGAERELAFAQAEFGEEGVEQFAAALGRAKRSVVQAFSLRQRLDDSEPETEQQQRQMLEQIQQLCRGARETLGAQAEAFAGLRDIASRLPQLVPALQRRVAADRALVADAAQTVREVSARFSPQAVQTVQTAPDEAEQRLLAAEQSLTGAPGAVQVRRAEELVAQAEQLLASVPRVATELQTAGEQLPRAVTALSTDLAGARVQPSPSPELAGAVAGAEAALAYAEASGRTDPLGSLGQVTTADTALDQAVAGAREQQARVDAARQRLPGLLTAAGAQVAAAEDLVATSRSVASSTARQLLAQASQLLTQAHAIAGSDPMAAADAAVRSDQLARRAQDQARADTDSWHWDADSDPALPGGIVVVGGGGGVLDAIFGGGWSTGGGFGGGFGGGYGGGSYGGSSGGWSGGGSSGRRSSSVRRSSSRGSSGGRRSSRRR